MKAKSTWKLRADVWLALYCVALGFIAGIVLLPLLGNRVPAFRDTFQFYVPLEHWLDAQRQTGDLLPQFNALDGTGANLVGETSSGLFYPGRLIWCLPGLSLGQRLWIVCVLHCTIAAGGAAYATRRMRLSPMAAALAATTYALSTPVFFQHTNIIYLIGAAWTPWALAECIALARSSIDAKPKTQHSAAAYHGGPRMWVWAGACSLMLLGGDPQATAHAGIVAVCAVVFNAMQQRSWPATRHRLLWLLGATSVVVGLTAVQWLPTAYWLQHSQRSASEVAPIAVSATQYEALPQLLRSLSETAPNTRQRTIAEPTYAFSIAPWHFLSLAWGTLGGHYMPDNSRWLQAYAAEPRMWIPSLSISLSALVLALSSWSQRSVRREQGYLLVVCFISGAAMLGNYAPVWFLRQIFQSAGAEELARGLPGDEVGGVYWLLTQIVPGYSAFRYPAKWSVWFACSLALCTACGLECFELTRRVMFRWSCAIAALTGSLFVCVGAIRWSTLGQSAMLSLQTWLARAPVDAWLGQPDTDAVMRTWMLSLGVALAVSTCCAVVARGSGWPLPIKQVFVVLALTELVYIAATWSVTVESAHTSLARLDATSSSLMEHSSITDRSTGLGGEPFALTWANSGRADIADIIALRKVAAGTRTRDLQSAAAQSRVPQLCNYQVAFQLGKLHLQDRARANLAALFSLTPRSLATVRRHLARADTLSSNNQRLDEALAWLGVSERLVRDDRLRWQTIPNPRPFVHWLAVSDALSEESIDTADVGRAGAAPKEFDPFSLSSLRIRGVSIEKFRAGYVQLRVSDAPGGQRETGKLLVRMFQDGGWTARLTSLSDQSSNWANVKNKSLKVQPVVSHLGLFQTLIVPSGKWIIELSYEAPGLRVGAAISIFSVILCASLFGYARRIKSAERARW